jgi:hypothetical protein
VFGEPHVERHLVLFRQRLRKRVNIVKQLAECHAKFRRRRLQPSEFGAQHVSGVHRGAGGHCYAAAISSRGRA